MNQRAWKLTLTTPGEPARSRVDGHHEMLEVLESVASGDVPSEAEVRVLAL